MCLPTGSLANQMSSVLLSASLAGWLACFLACSAVLVVSPMVDQVETLRKRGMKKKEEKKKVVISSQSSISCFKLEPLH